jgi:hypothetical protein
MMAQLSLFYTILRLGSNKLNDDGNDCDDVVAPADFCENDANQDVTATATE